MKWKDSRLHKPNSSFSDRYAVIFEYFGSSMPGFATWMPKDGYKDGEWQDVQTTRGNPLGGQVLYWHEFQEPPETAL